MFVEIRDGIATAQPAVVGINNALIIGKATGAPDTNPFLIQSIAGMPSSVIAGDQLYEAAQDYFDEAAGNAGLWCYVVSTDVVSQEEVLLDGARDSSNTEFYIPYSPLTAVSKVEVLIADRDTGSGWVTQPTTPTQEEWYITGTSNDTLNGQITLGVSGAYYNSGGIAISGLTLGPNDYIRADVTYGPMGKAFGDINQDDVYFQLFTFGYNQSKVQPQGPTEADDYKYHSGYCYSDVCWLKDNMLGAIMAGNFNSVGKYGVFCYSMPDNLKPNTIMTGYATGTSYNDGSYKYNNVRDIVGTSNKVAGFSAKQSVDGRDTAAAVMGTLMRDHPRKTLTTTVPTIFSQVDMPQTPEILGWSACQINVFLQDSSFKMWSSNFTHGTSNGAKINFNRCLGIFKKKLNEILLTQIMTRTLKYDLDGVMKIESAIASVQKNMVNLGYIDGMGKIVIPIKAYLQKEGSMSTGDQAILDAARASGILGDILVEFKWNGDIERIVISSLIPV